MSTQGAGGQQLESEVKGDPGNVRFDDGAEDYPPLRVATEEFANHAQPFPMPWNRPFGQSEDGLEDFEKQAGQQHQQNVAPVVLHEGSREEYVLLAEGRNLQLSYHALVLSDPVVGLRVEDIDHRDHHWVEPVSLDNVDFLNKKLDRLRVLVLVVPVLPKVVENKSQRQKELRRNFEGRNYQHIASYSA